MPLSQEEIESSLDALSALGFVRRGSPKDLIWVVNMFRQGRGRGPKIAAAVAKQLYSLRQSPLVEAFLDYYPTIKPYYESQGKHPRKNRGGKIPSVLRFKVLERDKHTCQYCGAKAPDVRLEVDHVVPIAAGGKTELANLKTACWACNIGKSDA